MIANRGINLFIGQNPLEHGLCYLAPKSIHRQNSPMHDSGVEKNPGGCAQAETAEPMRSLSYSGGDRSGSHLWGTGSWSVSGDSLTRRAG
jgi:hypothetical protein